MPTKYQAAAAATVASDITIHLMLPFKIVQILGTPPGETTLKLLLKSKKKKNAVAL